MPSSPNIFIAHTNPAPQPLEQVWFSRCPVPTASGLAYKLGWLEQAFAEDGLALLDLKSSTDVAFRNNAQHSSALFREGGNVPALAAKAQGAPSRLIGLTWIDEWQVILVRPESGISRPEHLKGKRLALPAFTETRGGSIARAMSLHGFKNVLNVAGLGLDDATFVDVAGNGTDIEKLNLWAGLDQLAKGTVDAVYVKGASAVEGAKRIGAVVGIDLDEFLDKRSRVNNGTPRPITVHQDLLDNHFDLVVKFLDQSLRAADWAANNLPALHGILESETQGAAEDVATAYRNDFHRSLHPDLSDERVGFLRVQKDFLRLHGFLEQDIDLDAWIDRRPLEAALRLRP